MFQTIGRGKIMLIGCLLFSSIIFTPISPVFAMSDTERREEMLLQIEQLMTLIALLHKQMAAQKQTVLESGNLFQYELTPTGQQHILPGSETAFARVTMSPGGSAEYVEDLMFSLKNTSGTEKPWDEFERVKVYANGEKLVDRFVFGESHWTQRVDGSYSLSLLAGADKIFVGDEVKVTIAFIGSTNVTGSRWEGSVAVDLNRNQKVIVGNGNRVEFSAAPGVLSDGLSCRIAATSDVYAFGEDVTLEWFSDNAVSARFTQDMSGKERVYSSDEALSPTGKLVIAPKVIGNPYVTLEVTASDGTTARCKTSFRMVSEENLKNGIVANIQPAFGKYSIADGIPVSWEVSGLSDRATEACVSFYARPIVGRNIGYGYKCFEAKNGTMNHVWYPKKDINPTMLGDYITSVVLNVKSEGVMSSGDQSVFEAKSVFTVKE